MNHGNREFPHETLMNFPSTEAMMGFETLIDPLWHHFNVSSNKLPHPTSYLEVTSHVASSRLHPILNYCKLTFVSKHIFSLPRFRANLGTGVKPWACGGDIKIDGFVQVPIARGCGFRHFQIQLLYVFFPKHTC